MALMSVAPAADSSNMASCVWFIFCCIRAAVGTKIKFLLDCSVSAVLYPLEFMLWCSVPNMTNLIWSVMLFWFTDQTTLQHFPWSEINCYLTTAQNVPVTHKHDCIQAGNYNFIERSELHQGFRKVLVPIQTSSLYFFFTFASLRSSNKC